MDSPHLIPLLLGLLFGIATSRLGVLVLGGIWRGGKWLVCEMPGLVGEEVWWTGWRVVTYVRRRCREWREWSRGE